ncbi:MAG: hypothetical protein A4E58_00815 [Syntrophorhabdus sp. PtaB.Bin006]|nr:MAG: hypothetical protein A4E58_00815 [Syntrophorhabdus sp. PtaB.Bin006]
MIRTKIIETQIDKRLKPHGAKGDQEERIQPLRIQYVSCQEGAQWRKHCHTAHPYASYGYNGRTDNCFTILLVLIFKIKPIHGRRKGSCQKGSDNVYT